MNALIWRRGGDGKGRLPMIFKLVAGLYGQRHPGRAFKEGQFG